ncbi:MULTISPECIES: hypothetical protein [unclassified Schlesneria]|uniref:hypothetical protein n=1 Tax=Schlesneria TaxID=656899 RepID=UPI0035A09EA2
MNWIHRRCCCSRSSLAVFSLFSCLLAGCSGPDFIVVETTEYHLPEADETSGPDDGWAPRSAPSFDPARVSPRVNKDMGVNLSACVTELDLSALKPDQDQNLLKVHSNFRDALASVQSHGIPILPSVDLIDAKSRQFDAGLITALAEFWFLGVPGATQGDLGFLQRIGNALPPDSRAAAYFAAGLDLAEIHLPMTNESAKEYFVRRYSSEVAHSEAAGFLKASEVLQKCDRVYRYFQMEFDLDDNDWMHPVVQVLKSDPSLAAEYRQILTRWSRVVTPSTRLTILDLVDTADAIELVRLRRDRDITSSAVSLFPPQSQRESELARRVFPLGCPDDEDLIGAMVRTIHSEHVDVRPTKESGWCDYQAYALTALLVPQLGDEARSLAFTGRYARRRLEVLEATMKKFEVIQTHEEQFLATAQANGQDAALFLPNLRLEPAPTYYLRMARSYEFLEQTLRQLIAEPQLMQLYGHSETGKRSLPLIQELQELKLLFYGCYAFSAEDLGMKVDLEQREQLKLEESRQIAKTWLGNLAHDLDLGVDARTIIPVTSDSHRQVTSALATLGVRFCRLGVKYRDRAAPHVKGSDSAEWKSIEPTQLGQTTYLLPVSDSSSVKIPRSQVPTRIALRRLCDELMGREEVLRRLQL